MEPWKQTASIRPLFWEKQLLFSMGGLKYWNKAKRPWRKAFRNETESKRWKLDLHNCLWRDIKILGYKNIKAKWLSNGLKRRYVLSEWF